MNIKYTRADKSDKEIIFQASKEQIDLYENKSLIDYAAVIAWVRAKTEKEFKEYSCLTADGKKAGHFSFRRCGNGMEIDDLFIYPEYRRKKLATAIIKKCISETALPVFIYVFINNTAAVSLYGELGFKIKKNIRNSIYLMEFRG